MLGSCMKFTSKHTKQIGNDLCALTSCLANKDWLWLQSIIWTRILRRWLMQGETLSTREK